VDAAIIGVMIALLALVVSEPFGIDAPIAAHLGRFVFFVVVSSSVAFSVSPGPAGSTGLASQHVPMRAHATASERASSGGSSISSAASESPPPRSSCQSGGGDPSDGDSSSAPATGARQGRSV